MRRRLDEQASSFIASAGSLIGTRAASVAKLAFVSSPNLAMKAIAGLAPTSQNMIMIIKAPPALLPTRTETNHHTRSYD
jgi:hypothetical protein